MRPIDSLGYRTDLMMLALQGSSIDDRDGYRVIRSPHNPTFHWGNFLLIDSPLAPGSVAGWLDTFKREFPDAEHLAIGIDGTQGDAGDVDELREAGLIVDLSTVMTCEATTAREAASASDSADGESRGIHLPPRPNSDAEFRMLRADSDQDWDGALAVMEAGNTEIDAMEYRVYASRRLQAMRRLQGESLGRLGGWFGAFIDGRMVAGLGLFSDGSGVARYQTVDTHPDYRNRGLAGTLVYTAGRYGFDQLGAHTLVMVADPEYSAIRLYRSVGFHDSETQAQLYRVKPAPDAR